MRRALLLALGFIAFAGAHANAAGLTVVVNHLRSDSGIIHLALWNQAEGFTDADAALILSETPAAAGQVSFNLGELAPGRYALASYHDENGNGKFDQTWIGWPDEGLGFSNGAWIGLGPPSFDEAAFHVRPETQTVTLALRYPANKPSTEPRLGGR